MKRPYLSIIIPCFNSEETIKPLLNSIFRSDFKDHEVIAVDDGSTDNTGGVISNFQSSVPSLQSIKQKNRGAGTARNLGAKKAKGKTLVFLDSDIVLYKNTLSVLAEAFEKTKEKVIVGFYDWKPANPNPGYFHWFKAMRDWAYWNIERDEKHPIGGFGGGIAAIERKLFKELGGFDESFKGAGMEDQEMGWRINQVTKIIFNPKIKVRHNYDGFLKTLKTFYIRSYLWFNLFKKYKKFFGPAMNPREALIAGLANLSTLLIFASFFLKSLWIVFGLVFVLRLCLGRRFLFLTIKKKGLLFLLASLFFSHALYLAVYLGIGRVILERVFKV